MAGTSMIVLTAGIIGTSIAPFPGLATLPVALGVVGVASATLPTGKLLARYGRRRVFMSYSVLAISAAVLAASSLAYQSFPGFCSATFLTGWATAAGHQYRFAALEAVPAPLAPRATAALLLGGLLGAYIGPELAVAGRWLLPVEFSGSFSLLALAYLGGLMIVSFYRDSGTSSPERQGRGRPTLAILRTRPAMMAVVAAGVAYGVMSLIMTATPISMTLHSGHSLEASKMVIQSHIAAMYLPSLVYGSLCAWLGFMRMLWTGVVILFTCLVVALIDTQLLHYWLALILLGVGWNFLFLTGTNLLPRGYRPEEKFRVQSSNDFVVFSVQALVALSSGFLLHRWQWHGLLWACLPLLLFFMLFLGRNGPSIEHGIQGKRPD